MIHTSVPSINVIDPLGTPYRPRGTYPPIPPETTGAAASRSSHGQRPLEPEFLVGNGLQVPPPQGADGLQGMLPSISLANSAANELRMPCNTASSSACHVPQLIHGDLQAVGDHVNRFAVGLLHRLLVALLCR